MSERDDEAPVDEADEVTGRWLNDLLDRGDSLTLVLCKTDGTPYDEDPIEVAEATARAIARLAIQEGKVVGQIVRDALQILIDRWLQERYRTERWVLKLDSRGRVTLPKRLLELAEIVAPSEGVARVSGKGTFTLELPG